MSGEGAPAISIPKVPGARVAIVSSQWHMEICQALVSGAQRACVEGEVGDLRVDWVPGSFELPLAAAMILDSGYDAAIVLGLVLRGETPHFDFVCEGVTLGIMNLTLESRKAIGFGVLMCDTLDQAVARAGLPGSGEDKGFEAATAALQMLHLQRSLVQ
ncbi:MAG TPA: 6,7-dimethyl-8-ribityllumazine synthase [Candidatus Paceibacterota bacterium]|nr:6,7-dimethyl-8-ribityllumazine synthase [Candidatus Paceibacterota bacterium]